MHYMSHDTDIFLRLTGMYLSNNDYINICMYFVYMHALKWTMGRILHIFIYAYSIHPVYMYIYAIYIYTHRMNTMKALAYVPKTTGHSNAWGDS
jgi:hypothetical protein